MSFRGKGPRGLIRSARAVMLLAAVSGFFLALTFVAQFAARRLARLFFVIRGWPVRAIPAPVPSVASIPFTISHFFLRLLTENTKKRIGLRMESKQESRLKFCNIDGVYAIIPSPRVAAVSSPVRPRTPLGWTTTAGRVTAR